MMWLVVVAAAIVGNGLGAWNIRTISTDRYTATAILTLSASLVQGTVARFNANHEWAYVAAWSIGSVIGILGAMHLDRNGQKARG